MANRVTGQKKTVSWEILAESVRSELESTQKELFDRAHARRAAQWHKRAKLAEFAADLENKGGFYQTGWCRSRLCEAVLKEHKATTRCVIDERTFTTCFNCDLESPSDVIVAKAY